jgi:hypothetical protein
MRWCLDSLCPAVACAMLPMGWQCGHSCVHQGPRRWHRAVASVLCPMERTAPHEKEHGPCSGVQGHLPRVRTLEFARDSRTHDRGELELRELVARQEMLLGDHGLWSPQARGGQRHTTEPPHCATQPPQPTNATQSLANASSCPYIELADDACTGQHGEGTWPVETGSKVMVGCRDPIGPARVLSV